MAKGNREGVIRLRVHEDFKREVEEAASRMDISASALARLAIRDYIARHGPERLRETGTSYGTPPPQSPDKKLRCAIAAAAVSTSYFVVTRKR